MRESDHLLIGELRQGRAEAYKFLYDHYYDTLCNAAWHYVRDDALAEMIVGDIMCRLWEKRSSLQIRYSVRAYLLSSVRNACLNYLNSKEARRVIDFSELEGTELHALAESLSECTDYLSEKELYMLVQDAFERMSTEARGVFIKSRVEELSYDEIAEEIGISKNTVKYHIKKALAAIRSELFK